ncbi:HAMP domain-containing protein [Nitriliruptoraceae bacterium ZYF776]|nr:HAMP domain-containing protein [Profundirhabdus halotolerans]
MSLRARLALTFTALTTTLVVGLAVGVQALLGPALTSRVDTALEDVAVPLLDEVAGETDPVEVLDELADVPLPAGRGLQVVDADGRVLGTRGTAGTTSLLDADLRAGVLAGQRATGEVELADGRARLVAVGEAGTIVVATEDLEVVTGPQRTLTGVLVPVGVVAALLAGVTAWVAAGRGLAPLRRIAAAADDVDAGQLDRRVPDPGTDDELGSLAATLNAMLDRLAATIERERRFTADASHELRTPLAILRGEVELARTRSEGRVATRLDSALEEADRLAGLVDDLLVLARADADAPPAGDVVDLGSLARATVARFAVLAADGGVALHAEGDATVLGDERALDRAVANLVDNAVRHTPPGGHVELLVGDEGDAVSVTVRDDGPGVAAEHLAGLFDRFARPDEARTSGDVDGTGARGGAGLGLAIVAAVVRSHGGEVTARQRDGGGLEVRLHLPRG